MLNGIDITNVIVDVDGTGSFNFDLGNISGKAFVEEGVIYSIKGEQDRGSSEVHITDGSPIVDGIEHPIQQAYDFWVA